MTFNFHLHAPQLHILVHQIISHPGNPLYNSFIISGDEIGGTLAIEDLHLELTHTYPERKFLYYERHEILSWVRSISSETLTQAALSRPKLLGVLLGNLELSAFTLSEQDKLASILKTLTKQQIQVAVSTSIVAGIHFSDHTALSKELWSWYMSGREYILPRGQVIYTKDLTEALTLEQDKKRIPLPQGHTAHPGQLYPGILAHEPFRNFHAQMNMQVGLLWRGSFEPPCYLFPRAICPRCKQAHMIPYACIASILSGGHVLKFYCLHCKQRLATNQAADYYQLIRTYGTRARYRK